MMLSPTRSAVQNWYVRAILPSRWVCPAPKTRAGPAVAALRLLIKGALEVLADILHARAHRLEHPERRSRRDDQVDRIAPCSEQALPVQRRGKARPSLVMAERGASPRAGAALQLAESAAAQDELCASQGTRKQ